VALLALIAGTVSYLHMHMLVELHDQPGWVAALTPLRVADAPGPPRCRDSYAQAAVMALTRPGGECCRSQRQ
jgi:hypothetical protein